jgi:hypothetical protein
VSPGNQDDRAVVVVVAAEARHASGSGVARAALLLLGGDVGPTPARAPDVFGDLLGAMADDDDRACRVQPLQGVDDVQHHRATANAVQRLVARPHAGPGARTAERLKHYQFSFPVLRG